MLRRLLFGHVCRSFSRSSAWRNLEKVKPPPESPTESSSKPLDMSMSFAPTELDKKILLLSGKFKSRQDIPPRIRFETMDNAKSRLRIRVSTFLMIMTVVASICVIFVGKKRQKEGDTILRRMLDREKDLKEEAQRQTKP